MTASKWVKCNCRVHENVISIHLKRFWDEKNEIFFELNVGDTI